jgi:hypothetical protein
MGMEEIKYEQKDTALQVFTMLRTLFAINFDFCFIDSW